MAKGLDSKRDSSSILKRSVKEARREAQENMINYGGQWHVVKLGKFYAAVGGRYLQTHNVKPVCTIKSMYEVEDKWWQKLLIPPIKLLTKILKWLTVK